MENAQRMNNLILMNGALLVGVASPHLIDDFLFGIPEEFRLTNLQAQVISDLFSVALIVIFVEVGRGKRSGLIGAGIIGIFLVLTGVFKHVPLMLEPRLYWGDLFLEMLIIALILSGLSLFCVSIYALRRNNSNHSQAREDV